MGTNLSDGRLSDLAAIQWAVDDYDVDHPKRVCRGHEDLLDWVQGV